MQTMHVRRYNNLSYLKFNSVHSAQNLQILGVPTILKLEFENYKFLCALVYSKAKHWIEIFYFVKKETLYS